MTWRTRHALGASGAKHLGCPQRVRLRPMPHRSLAPALPPADGHPTRDWPEYSGERDHLRVFDNGVAPYWWVGLLAA